MDKAYNLNNLGEIKTNPHRKRILANLLAPIIKATLDTTS